MEKLIIAKDADLHLGWANSPKDVANPQAAGHWFDIKDSSRAEYRNFLPARLVASEIETRSLKTAHIDDHNRQVCEIYSKLSGMLRSPGKLQYVRDIVFDEARLCDFARQLPIGGIQELDSISLYNSFHSFFDDITKTDDGLASKQTTFLSINPLCNFMYLFKAGPFSRSHILAILAISGIVTTLPAIFFEEESPIDEEVIETIREKYSTERNNYIEYLSQFTQECYERIVDGYYADAWQYATIKTNEDIKQLCKRYESAVKKSDQNLKKHLLIGSVHGIPEITRSFMGQSIPQAIGIEVLRILSSSLSQRIREQRAESSFPMAAYIYNIRRELKAHQEGTARSSNENHEGQTKSERLLSWLRK